MLDHQSSQLLDRFEELGLSRTEASVYLALLRSSQAITGYQLAKDSGLSRPIVYEMLNRLVEKGGAKISKNNEVHKKNPEKFSPISPEIFLMSLDKRFSDARTTLIDTLSKVSVPAPIENDDFWNLSNIDSIVMTISKLIQEAQKNIYFYINNQEYASLFKSVLSKSAASKITCIGFSYRPIELPGTELYSYELDLKTIYPQFRDDQIIIVVDEVYSVVADMHQKKACQSTRPIQVQTALEFIKLKIVLFRLQKFLPSENLALYLFEDQRTFFESLQ